MNTIQQLWRMDSDTIFQNLYVEQRENDMQVHM